VEKLKRTFTNFEEVKTTGGDKLLKNYLEGMWQQRGDIRKTKDLDLLYL
jgi:hypothetical protein